MKTLADYQAEARFNRGFTIAACAIAVAGSIYAAPAVVAAIWIVQGLLTAGYVNAVLIGTIP